MMPDYEVILVREQLQAAEARYDQSVINNSPEGMLRFYQELTSPDFVEKDNPAGTVTTRERMLRGMEAVIAAGACIGYKELIGIKSTVDALTVEGDTATATITHFGHYVQTDTHGWHGPPGEDIEWQRADKWERVWARSPGGWRLHSSRLIGPAD